MVRVLVVILVKIKDKDIEHAMYGTLKKTFFNVYFLERDTHSASGGGAEREGDTESKAGSRL